MANPMKSAYKNINFFKTPYSHLLEHVETYFNTKYIPVSNSTDTCVSKMGHLYTGLTKTTSTIRPKKYLFIYFFSYCNIFEHKFLNMYIFYFYVFSFFFLLFWPQSPAKFIIILLKLSVQSKSVSVVIKCVTK